jgi:uncharacterized membrane protein
VNREGSIEIDAPATKVWKVFSDIARWPEWTESVERVVPQDGPDVRVGAHFAIKQPRLPEMVWEVIEVDAGRAWKWRTKSFGVTTVGWHEVAPLGDARAVARQGIDQHGPLAFVVGLFTARLTDRYLTMEARGLKSRSEQTAGDTSGS